MCPLSKFEIILNKIKCFLGLHDWVTDESNTTYCWNCGKERGV